jgi:hypothetical protein
MQSRLAPQLAEAAAALHDIEAPFALIGGLALAAHGVVRATHDVDFLVEAGCAGAIDEMLRGLGYRCEHRSADSATYLRGDERLDMLYASRPTARQLLARAKEAGQSIARLRVVSAEGLIGFKLQALVNDPRRTQDLEDIRALLRANPGNLDLAEVREYFRLFDREPQLDELLGEIR